MKVLTIKSTGSLDEDMQTEVHHRLGMEHYTDYVFKPRGDGHYSATIVLEDSEAVIGEVVAATAGLKGLAFVIDDLDMEKNSIERIHASEGNVEKKVRSGWKWD